MKLVRLVAVAGLALGAAPQLHAVPLDGSTSTICLFAGSLNSCASVSVSVAGSVLTATVQHAGGNADYALAGFGFFYIGASNGSSILLNPNPSTVLGDKVWNNGLGLGLTTGNVTPNTKWLGGATRASGGGNRLFAGDPAATFSFNITGTLPGTVYFAFRGQDWDGPGGSFKCREFAGSTPSAASCEPGVPDTTIPEPATMLLLATGLVGMGGATVLRRRRQKNQA